MNTPNKQAEHKKIRCANCKKIIANLGYSFNFGLDKRNKPLCDDCYSK